MERKVAREFRHKVRFKHYSYLCIQIGYVVNGFSKALDFTCLLCSMAQVGPSNKWMAVGLADNMTKNKIATKAGIVQLSLNMQKKNKKKSNS